jgi:3-oxoacyl-[acyl-carrier protein] reductase
VVTAAAGIGIGGTIVRRLLAEGATVVASDAHEGRVKKLAADTAAEAEVVDVRDQDALRAHLNAVLTRHGCIDVLVNCAGTNAIAPLWELTEDQWQRVFDVNVSAMLRACRTAVPSMIEAGRGSIVNIASIAAAHPFRHEGAYSITKAAVVALTRALAKDLAENGVRANAVAPNFVENRFLANVYAPDRLDRSRRAMPFRRGVDPAEVAAVVAFLASDDASYVTGEVITIGGQPFHQR